MKKPLVGLTALILAITSLAGCGSGKVAGGESQATQQSGADSTVASNGETQETTLRFTLVLPMNANEVWNACAEGFEAACAAMGVEGNVVSPAKPNDVNEMNALIETAIADGVDGVITQAVNPEGQAPAFAKLDEAGIPFCLVNSDAPESNRLAFIGTGDELGRVGGQAIVEAMNGEKIYFATALFSLTAPIAISLHEAYLQELEKNPGGFEEVVVLETQSDQMISIQEWTNAFMTYPEINAGMAICGFGALGAAKAMNELGIKDVIIIGIDDVAETLDGIRDGTIYGTMTQNFFRMGYEPVVWMQNLAATGQKPEQEVHDSGTMLVTKENIDTYAADMRDPTKW